VGDFITGVRYFGQGFGMLVRRPKLLMILDTGSRKAANAARNMASPIALSRLWGSGMRALRSLRGCATWAARFSSSGRI
jgi:hypothetical protein